RTVAKGGRAVTELELCGRPRLTTGAGHVPARLDQDLAQLLAPAPGVLIDSAAHRPGHADRELEAAQTRVGDDARESHHLQTGGRPHARPFDDVFAGDHA